MANKQNKGVSFLKNSVELELSFKDTQKENFIKVIKDILNPDTIFEQETAAKGLAFRKLARDKGVDLNNDSPILALEKMGAYISRGKVDGEYEIYIQIWYGEPKGRLTDEDVSHVYSALFMILESSKDYTHQSYLLASMPDNDGTIIKKRVSFDDDEPYSTIYISPDTKDNIAEYLENYLDNVDRPQAKGEYQLYHEDTLKEYTLDDYKLLHPN